MRRWITRQDSTLGRRRSNIPALACAFSAAATTGGTIYAFGVFANDLKHALGLSQMELGAISAAFFISGFFSWIPGIIVDKMKMRFSMATGGISGAFFTMVYWTACRFPNWMHLAHPVAVLSILAVCISLSCGLIIGSVFKLTLLCGGTDGQGPSVGIAKGFTGLGSGIYATIFQAFRDENETTLDFLPVIAFFFLLCATLPALTLLPCKNSWHPHLMEINTTPWHFRTMYIGLLLLCLFIVGSAFIDIWKGGDEPKGRQFGKLAVVLVFWLVPIVTIVFLPRKEEEPDDFFTSQEPIKAPAGKTETDSLLGNSPTIPTGDDDDEEDEGNGEFISAEERKSIIESWRAVQEEELAHLEPGEPAPEYPEEPRISRHHIIVDFRADLSLLEMLQTSSAWLMLWTAVILVGSGTAKTNNMGQMVESLGFAEEVTPATLAIFAVAQGASRIATGIVSEAALKWKIFPDGIRMRLGGGTPRPFFLAVASCISLVGHLMLTFSTDVATFVIGNVISALAFGMAWPLMVLIVGDVFGTEHHGANYMFYDGFTKAVGTLSLSTFVAGSVYQAHVGEDGITCLGPQCFQTTHMVIAALAVTCLLASFVLCYTSRHAYVRR